MHEENGCNKNEGGTAIHVDGCADGENETADGGIDAHVFFRRSHGDRKRCSGTLCKEGNGKSRGHGFHDADRVEAADEEKERQNDEELDEVPGHDDERITA